MKTISNISVWKTVTLGVLGDKVKEMISYINLMFSFHNSPFIKGPSGAIRDTKLKYLDLVKVNAEALGLTRYSRMKDIYDKVKELGLELCPAEVAVQVATQFELGQSDRDVLFIGTGTVYNICGDKNQKWIFVIRTENNEQKVHGVYWTKDQMIGDREWVFVKPRQTAEKKLVD